MSKIMVPHKSDMSGPCQRESSQATANTAEGRRGRDKRLREKTCMCGTQLGWEGGREKEGRSNKDGHTGVKGDMINRCMLVT